eukprot:TRINITY_DN380_c0_g1_i5.p1 TRINITY_DN380_c0_g1~~TRINITY_DN380_c0_g1_i5.p1  ORF type:complete len:316 (+),score=105.06 TRINITY_DN380_c0_g1_i5:80-1027(+)
MRKQVKPMRSVQVRSLKLKPVQKNTQLKGTVGKGGGAGGGKWVYVPAGAKVNKVLPSMIKKTAGGKGSAKGAVKGAAKGAGKGAVRSGAKTLSKYEEKLKKIDASLKVWIGGLAEGTSWKDVEKHFTSVAKPTVTDVMKKGTAVVAYKTTEDVETAVASLNGSELKGNTIEVDVWVQKPKAEKSEKPKKAKKQLPMKAPPAKAIKTVKKTAANNDKMREKLAAFPPEKKVWVGGLTESTTWKALEKHLATVAKPKLTHIHKKKGCVVYESEDDVATVIAALNGSELDGKMIEVDVWTKAEKPEKKAKGEVAVKEE